MTGPSFAEASVLETVARPEVPAARLACGERDSGRCSDATRGPNSAPKAQAAPTCRHSSRARRRRATMAVRSPPPLPGRQLHVHEAPPAWGPASRRPSSRAQRQDASRSAAIWCRSILSRRASRSSCWCPLSAPAFTCRRRPRTRSFYVKSAEGIEITGTFDPV